MTKREAIIAIIAKLAGDDADIPNLPTTKDALAFLAECLDVDNGAVTFAVPEE